MSTTAAVSPGVDVAGRLRAYWSLLKMLQSGLLVVTALAGYVSGCCLSFTAGSVGALFGSMLAAVTGSTVVNMVLDRDIDARMVRTAGRPLVSGVIGVREALTLGAVLTATGVAWAFWLSPLYGALVLTGWVVDVVVYTVLLKRTTPLSVVFGGVSGAMPVLAGRALATGTVDGIGLLLALGVLLWIPLHIVTLTMSRAADYARAGIPTIPGRYGHVAARWVVAVTILLAAAAIVGVTWQLWLPFWVQATLGGAAVVLALSTLAGVVRPGRVLELASYKGASLFMLAAMVAIIGFGL